jgi:hypothetical protein
MSDAKLRAETVFQRNQRREAEINDALKQEKARHASAVRNMYRLRALRLARKAEPSANRANGIVTAISGSKTQSTKS